MSLKKCTKDKFFALVESFVTEGMERGLAEERAREIKKSVKRLHLREASTTTKKKVTKKPRVKKEKLTGSAGEKVEKYSDEIPQFVKNFNTITQAAWLKSQKSKSRKFAIRAMCLMCVGGSANDVKTCTDKNCPLYQFRIKG